MGLNETIGYGLILELFISSIAFSLFPLSFEPLQNRESFFKKFLIWFFSSFLLGLVVPLCILNIYEPETILIFSWCINALLLLVYASLDIGKQRNKKGLSNE